jgi:hypothetical protein
MRKSGFFFTYFGILSVIVGLLVIHAKLSENRGLRRIQKEAAMVQELALTDLCLFTEASYTRHLSQADVNTPFQDSPMALEHFPSGSLVPPARPIVSSRHSIPTGTRQRDFFPLNRPQRENKRK